MKWSCDVKDLADGRWNRCLMTENHWIWLIGV